MTSAGFGSSRECMRIWFRKKLWNVHMTCHFVLPFSVWGHASLLQAKRDLRKEKIRSSNDAWKSYLKTWDWWNSESFQGHCPWNPAARVIVLTYIGLSSMAIKLNPSWKNEVSKSVWIKPCYCDVQTYLIKYFECLWNSIFCPFRMLKVRDLYNCPYVLLL